jgi:hypothetical protein
VRVELDQQGLDHLGGAVLGRERWHRGKASRSGASLLAHGPPEERLERQAGPGPA